MTREKVTLIGCGGWGSRIARKLAARGDVELVLVDDDRTRVEELAGELGAGWSCDPFGYLMVSGTQRSSVEQGSVIVATPPSTRREVVNAVLHGYGLAPKRLRIEKPLAIAPHDARQIVKACNAAGVQLSVGFTLLHDALYEQAFRWMRESCIDATRVYGSRIGRRSRHRADALVDLGSHTASIAAYLGASCCISARYSDDECERVTRIELDTGDEIVVEEIAGTLVLPDSEVCRPRKHDALEAELNAWLVDEHRAGASLGLRATHHVWDHLAQVAGVAA